MRFFDTDWNMILAWVRIWEKLSPAARRYYLAAKTHAESVSPGGYGEELELALSLELVEPTTTGRVKPTKASTPFRSLMVQLAKWPLFEGKPEREQLNEYLHKHYTSDEQQTLRISPAWDSRERPESFLHTADIAAWERPLLSYPELAGDRYSSGYGWGVRADAPPKKTWFTAPEPTETAQFLVRRALESQRPWPLKALGQELPKPLRPALDAALKACLRHGLLFAALDKHSLDLLVGVCPILLYLANRPAPVSPALELCAKVQGVPYHVEDMTQVLALAAAGECLLNQGGYARYFFKSVEARLQEEFVPLPEWLADRADFFERLHAATDRLLQLGFATDTYRKEPKRKLKATAAGRKWLAQTPTDRLQAILFECQRVWKHEDWEETEDSEDAFWDAPDEEEDFWDDPSEEENPEESADADETRSAVSASGRSVQSTDLLQWQKAVWCQAPTQRCVSLEAFLDYHARVSCIQPTGGHSGGSGGATAPPKSQEAGNLAAEERCRARLKNFFWRVLVPFGCVEATRSDPQDLSFRLSAAGQYLTGLKESLPHEPKSAEAPVVVQPNFEIVFLGPDLGAEVALAPFAERCGRNVGSLFRLTRPKMIQAAARGATAEGVLSTLAKYSSKPVPENVVAEVQSWFAACRALTVRHSTLIEAGEAETALKVREVLGPECKALSATLLEWPEPALPPKLTKKLREQGLFVEEEP